jgi:hypothetical protein
MNIFEQQETFEFDGKNKAQGKEGEETLGNYLNIWKINPSFKDINSTLAILRALFLVAFTMFFIMGTFMISSDLIFSVVIGFITLLCFVMVFHTNFFSLEYLFSRTFSKSVLFDPFENHRFFITKSDSDVLFVTNKKDLKTCALCVFKVGVISENIYPTLNKFIKSLNDVDIAYTYQVVQSPLIEPIAHKSSTFSKVQQMHSIQSFTTNIYFSVFYDSNGILTKKKLLQLQEKIREYRDIMKANFTSNFYHFKINILSGSELIRALPSIVFKNTLPEVNENNDSYAPHIVSSSMLIKLAFVSFLLLYGNYVLLFLHIPLLMVACFTITTLVILLFLWWRSLFFPLSNSIFHNKGEITIVEPFKIFDFYRFKAHPDTLFFHIAKKILGAVKMDNLKYASPVFLNNIPFCYPDKFYRALITQKLSFTYTLTAAPLSFYRFDKEAYKYLNDKSKNSILQIHDDKGGQEWLTMRAGIWKTLMTYAVNTYQFINTVKKRVIMELEQELTTNMKFLENTFKMNFHTFELVPLKNNKLLAGYLMNAIKNKFFRIDGTHLNYLFFQGKGLIFLTELSPTFKRGVETRLATEFNTPLQLENFITFGHTINTEVLEEELPVGLLLEQIHKLLIVNGSSADREALTMKIVSELVKVQVPSLIFDFNGTWSKLIKYFDGSRFEDDFLYFKLGSTFTLDPIHSEIPFDKDNIKFLDYMFDAYALSFKKLDNTMTLFKNTILRNPDVDITTLSLQLKNQQTWSKGGFNDAMATLFDEFTQADFEVFHTTAEGQDTRITFYDFIKDDRTVIVDLSISNDHKKQEFLMFLILSKIVHYINNFNTYSSKIIIAPRLDLFFDAFYLDKTSNYGAIDRFLEPLFQNGFGMVLSANQIKYLHHNIYNYFYDLITFRATDQKDLAIIRNQMSLQELKGVGYYSASRNTSYQMDYLLSLKNDEALVKRSDLYQAFPVILDVKELTNTNVLENEEIMTYMKRQKYDLHTTEKRLLEQTKKTIFEKDLGSFFVLLEELIKFLNGIKTMEKVGNLYKTKVNEELKKAIYQKAKNLTKDKMKLKEFRDELFETLIKHGYLVEAHPKSAGGSQTIGTSYKVGDKFQVALQDYFETKKNSPTDISLEVVEQEIDRQQANNDITQIFTPKKSVFQDVEFEEVLVRHLSDVFYYLFQSFTLIKNKKFEQAIQIERQVIRQCLLGLYKELYPVNYIVSDDDLKQFIVLICKEKMLPFTPEELTGYLQLDSQINLEEMSLEEYALELYKKIQEFFDTIQKFLGDNGVDKGGA